ncbi:hypothetical protein [Natronobeatus ordinarius]|uniref:EMC6-like membrane protein n=1 Tax=Natronobeatus ordinarius TaxID=2963433 RepID=UPI0020CC07F5|nr:hypothetical protein [Natronobeatus ordinarius]
MSTESISDRGEHVRSIGVTAFAALLGVAAAFLSLIVTGEPATLEEASAAATDQRAYLIVLGAIVVQFPLINLAGIYEEDEFGFKHYLFITFMTFSIWFVVWGILLTTQATA